MKDNWGDKVTVESSGESVWVSFVFDDEPGESSDMQFSPAKARKFIRKLQQATAQAEIAQRDAE